MKDSAGKILIDSSIWIEYFRGKSDVGEVVDRLIDEDRAVIIGPIISELVQGLKDKTKVKELISNFEALPYIDIKKSNWVDIGILALNLKKKGINIPFTDMIIAAIATKYHLYVYSLDKHFNLVTGLLKYRVDENKSHQ